MQHILRTDGSTRLHSVSSRESYSIGLCVNLFTVDAPFGSATSAHRAAGFQHHDIVITTLSRSAASRSRQLLCGSTPPRYNTSTVVRSVGTVEVIQLNTVDSISSIERMRCGIAVRSCNCSTVY